MSETYVDVALPVPLFQTFTYALDPSAQNTVAIGSRVVVPFRSSRAIGIVVRTNAERPAKGKVKTVLEVPDQAPVLSAGLLETGRWIAEYYVAPLGVVLRSMLPVVLTEPDTPNPAGKTRRIVHLAPQYSSDPNTDDSVHGDLPIPLTERDALFKRTRRQREVFELLEAMGGTAPVEHVLQQLDVSSSVIKTMERRGIVTITDERVDRDPFTARPPIAAHTHPPTPAQAEAIANLAKAAPGSVTLLHGVTGSGKTLVYIELLRTIVLERNQSAIVLVPEIALTPQTVDRFRSVFGDRVAVLHSALSDGERYDAWRALQRGDKQIAVGARSALFAPLNNLGAIILDEEHESSYKQGETPRYHARETAIVRAHAEGAIVVLGSATPSLETWVNATNGKYTLLTLPARAGAGTLPVIDVADLRKQTSQHREMTPYTRVISDPLDAALRKTLDAGEQSILLLNRRGYSSFVQCDVCGYVAVCPNCSISLTLHRGPDRLICHYCLHKEAPQTTCPQCATPQPPQNIGLGTQQIERLLAERFPQARIARMDVDTTAGKWAHATILDRVGRGEIDILLGTQMIAKGLDFPNVTLVGVVDADVGINLPDFRASERCFQLLSQVAGRAGRGAKGGRVIIQTRLPRHHAVQCAVAHDYHAFVNTELEERKSPPYPPTNRLANIVTSGTAEQPVADLALAGADWVRRLLEARSLTGIEVVGPAFCPLERIKGRWRWHLVLKSEHPALLTQVSHYFATRFPVPKAHGLRVIVDRDPVSLL